MRKLFDFVLLCVSAALFALTVATAVFAANSCEEDNFDVGVIVGAMENGVLKPYVVAKAQEALDSGGITPARFEAIKKLIDDAYQYPPEHADLWGEQHRKHCDDA